MARTHRTDPCTAEGMRICLPETHARPGAGAKLGTLMISICGWAADARPDAWCAWRAACRAGSRGPS